MGKYHNRFTKISCT